PHAFSFGSSTSAAVGLGVASAPGLAVGSSDADPRPVRLGSGVYTGNGRAASHSESSPSIAPSQIRLTFGLKSLKLATNGLTSGYSVGSAAKNTSVMTTP